MQSPKTKLAIKAFAAIPFLALLIFVPGCAQNQMLETVTVTPSMGVFGSDNPTGVIQLTATGSYLHPAETKDITNQVVWSSDVTQVVVVNSTGAVSPSGLGCGVANVTATVFANAQTQTGNAVSGTATITVNGTAPGCPDMPI